MAVQAINRSSFFTPRVTNRSAALPVAEKLIKSARAVQPGATLLLSEGSLAVNAARLEPDRLLNLIAPENMNLAAEVAAFASLLGTEVRDGEYQLQGLMDAVSKSPSFSQPTRGQFNELNDLRQKGVNFTDLPESIDEAMTALGDFSRDLNISIEYLTGNLEKVLRLMKLLGVRNKTTNLNAIFHNFQNGFYELSLAETNELASLEMIERAGKLVSRGVNLEIYATGAFNRPLTSLSAEQLDAAISSLALNYQTTEAAVRKFVGALIASEEKRMSASPALSLRELLAAFRFSDQDESAVAIPPMAQIEDPTRWQETELGQALRALRPNLNWLAISAGVRAAGDLADLKENPRIKARLLKIKEMLAGHSINISSGRSGRAESKSIGELSEAELLFDLYCLAVINKRTLAETIKAAFEALHFIVKLGNSDPIVYLDELIEGRLKGESFATLLGTQGLILRDSPIGAALEKLRSVADKVELTVADSRGNPVSLKDTGIDEFRRAIILMGRGFREPHSPERVLSAIGDRVVPEITRLPQAVVAPGAHDLARLVELAIAGIPARYPLRRPWDRVNLDGMAFMGSGLEPGIRNCLGCPVNVLYGTVIKAALASGFSDITTYEATGCFEVYGGIWPYTGKKIPTLHGVFGGVASEMLGGLAAKRARLKYALKTAGEIAQTLKILHLGWGGDGATFDIGFGNLSGLFSRLQKLVGDELTRYLVQRALYVCVDNEGYQNTGNQWSAATPPGGNTTTYPEGKERPMGSDIRKKPIVEIIANHGVGFAARTGIHRPEHISRIVARALEDGERGAFLHFLQPCTTGWKFKADNIAYDLAFLAETGRLFPPLTIEHGIPYLEVYPTPRNPGEAFLGMQARFKHLMGAGAATRENVNTVMEYYRSEWIRNVQLAGYDGEISESDRFRYLGEEHRLPRINV